MTTIERAFDDPYLPESPARFRDVVYALVAGVLAAIVGGGTALVVLGLNASDPGAAALAVSLISQSLGSVAVFWWLSNSRGSGNWSTDFGVRVRIRDAWWLFGGFALQLAAALVIAPVVQIFAPDDAPRQSVVVATEEATGTLMRILLLVLIVVVAAAVEEIIFRGMMLAALRRTMAPWPSILVSAGAFALLHFVLDPDALLAVPGLFLIGIGLGWAALRGGDLSAPFFIHAGVNLTGALVLLFGDSLVDSSVLHLGWW